MPERVSYGIACVRVARGTPEILMVRKRITYAFCAFARGRYSTFADLRHLFDKMTTDEKLCILSFRFSIIYYHFNLSPPGGDQYHRHRAAFESAIARFGEPAFRRAITASTNAQLIWEIPKGRAQPREAPMAAAIREFKEETTLDKSAYSVLPATAKVSHTDGGINYLVTYYFAKINADAPRPTPAPTLYEVGEVRWMSLADLSFGRCSAARVVAKKLFSYCQRRYLL